MHARSHHDNNVRFVDDVDDAKTTVSERKKMLTTFPTFFFFLLPLCPSSRSFVFFSLSLSLFPAAAEKKEENLMINEFLWLCCADVPNAHTHTHTQRLLSKRNEGKEHRSAPVSRLENEEESERKEEKAGNLFSCPDGRYAVLSDSRLSLSKCFSAGVSINNLVKTKKNL